MAEAPAWATYTTRQRWTFLTVLFLVSTSNYFDRHVVSVVLEPIKREFHVSDTMLGLFSGFCFAIFYTVCGIPLARWADRGDRPRIIALALLLWSLMTMLCGIAQTFAQLAFARIGVGVGEAGAIPPAQSLIVDYFPPDRRATALSIFTAAGTAGSLLAFGCGGVIAAHYGWRSAFLLAGAPGLLLAAVVPFTLAEPRREQRSLYSGLESEGWRQSLEFLWRKRSFRYAAAGCVCTFLMQYGGLAFVPTYLVRTLHIPLSQVGVSYGAIVSMASLIGTIGGGWLSDRLGRDDIRWFAWIPAIACTVAGVLYAWALSLDTLGPFLTFAFVAYLLLTGGTPPAFAAIHAVCGSRRRATAIALVLFLATLLGAGIGPLAVGQLSDAFSAAYGVMSLRYALMLMMVFLVIGGAFFYGFGRLMPVDLEA